MLAAELTMLGDLCGTELVKGLHPERIMGGVFHTNVNNAVENNDGRGAKSRISRWSDQIDSIRVQPRHGTESIRD